jgi:hypothetical protein
MLHVHSVHWFPLGHSLPLNEHITILWGMDFRVVSRVCAIKDDASVNILARAPCNVFIKGYVSRPTRHVENNDVWLAHSGKLEGILETFPWVL